MTEKNELFSALAKAQMEFEVADLDKVITTQQYKAKYASFPSMVNASRGALNKNGLSVIFNLYSKDEDLYLQSILAHSSGQYIENVVKAMLAAYDVMSIAKWVGSIKRIMYAGLTGVMSYDEDEEHSSVAPARTNVEKISKDQLEQLEYELKGHEKMAIGMMEKLNLNRLADLPKADFLSVLNKIRSIKSIEKK